MISNDAAKKLALSLPQVSEQDHFGKPSFRVKKKIFATLWADSRKMMVKLSLVDQSVFHSYNPDIFYPVEGWWGKQGATFIDLKKVKKSMLEEALKISWSGVAPSSIRKEFLSS